MFFLNKIFKSQVNTFKSQGNTFKSKILESELFDKKFYIDTYPDIKGMDPLEHYLEFGIKEDRKPNEDFDPVWYREYYPDIVGSHMGAFQHYVLFGKDEGRYPNPYAAGLQPKPSASSEESTENELHKLKGSEQQEYELILGFKLGWEEYIAHRTHSPFSSDPIVDYILSWKEHQPVIPHFFDTAFYLDIHPDIKDADVNPLIHYLTTGRVEGRQALFNEDNIFKGKREYDPEKETVIFVSHESSATGAPILGYNIADKLVERFNIIHIVIRESDIHESFLENCDMMLCGIQDNPYTDAYVFLKVVLKNRDIKCIVCNSAVTSQVLSAADTLNIPSLLLIHEFNDYVKPAGTVMGTVFQADNIIVPATIIQDSVQEELTEYANNTIVPKSMHIIPQGKLPYIPEGYGENDSVEQLCKKLKIDTPDDAKIVVGSGWVQMRKGVDLFVATAKQIKKKYKGNCKFVWVGGGYEPEKDMAYSVWLRRELKFSGLDDDFIFLEHQKSLDTIFSISDVFCLTSRMDPFPNVVIDALDADLHIACFDNATGSSEFLDNNNANCTVVEYLDTYALADGIIDYFEIENAVEKKTSSKGGVKKGAKVTTKKSFKGVNKALVSSKLDFDTYVDEIERLIDDSVAFKKKSMEIVKVLLEKDEFNADYYDTEGTAERRCQKYVESSLKALRLQNPKPGFSQLKWLHDNGKEEEGIVPIFEAIKQGNTRTHDTQLVPYELEDEIAFFYAVHLHLFYADLAEEFANYFKNLPGKFDILVTIVNEEDKEHAEKAFSQCGANEVKVVLVKNIGRDSGPLFFGLKEEIFESGYEVIGHFHSKKSFDVEGGIGDRWRTYLTETLIGDETVAKSIIGMFNASELGLVFPDDRHVIDIGENQKYIDELCKMMQLPEMRETPLFPLGNMFWGRVEALKDLFELDPDAVLQEEPLPYDGSYMHAIERITPVLVEKNGYKYKTVYRESVTW